MNKHTLVVDDCEDVRFLLALKLQKLGFDVVEATDANEALELINEDEEIELLLMDIVMPGQSGLELLEQINDMKLKKKMIVILITASKDEDIFKRALDLGADGLITKPIKDSILKEQLNMILNKNVA